MGGRFICDAERLMRPFGDAVAATPSHLAPERRAELPSIFGDPPWELVFLNGATNFKAVPASGGSDPEIHSTYWALLSLWAAAKASVLIVDAVSAALEAGEKTIQTEPSSAYHTASRYLKLCRDLTRNRHASFPTDLDEPSVGTAEPAGIRTNNLFLGAVGWVLLHEMGHIHLNHEVDVTRELSFEREYEADRFATEWVLPEKGIPTDHYQFRVFAIATAMLWIGQMNEVKRGSATHPPAVDRLDRCVDLMTLSGNQTGIELATYILKVAFLPNEEIGEFDTAAGAFNEVLYQYSRQPQ